MKRHASLHAFSEEHHLGLVEARRRRRAAAGTPADVVAAARGFLSFWDQALVPHFRAEEEILLPRYALRVPADDPLIVRLLVEHVRIRQRVLQVAGCCEGGAAPQEDVAWLGRFLDEHIRFEERVLFPAIEAALPEDELAGLCAALSAAGIAKGSACRIG